MSDKEDIDQDAEQEMYDCEEYDRKKFSPKLDGMIRVSEKELVKGTHVRYTYNGYQSGRRTVYGVVMLRRKKDSIPFRPYKGKLGQPFWSINISPEKNKYKNYHFYVRPPRDA